MYSKACWIFACLRWCYGNFSSRSLPSREAFWFLRITFFSSFFCFLDAGHLQVKALVHSSSDLFGERLAKFACGFTASRTWGRHCDDRSFRKLSRRKWKSGSRDVVYGISEKAFQESLPSVLRLLGQFTYPLMSSIYFWNRTDRLECHAFTFCL